MADVSIAQHYHQRTKYHPETLAAQSQSGGLDWSQQPIPYKDYKIGHSVDLKPYLEEHPPAEQTPGTGSVTGAQPTSEVWRWWRRLSRLLIDSYGLTAKVMTFSGEAMYLRSAPSAGGLYPAELYLVSRGTSLLPAGLYNYQVRTHSLWRFWDDHPWQDLQAACFWHPSLETTQLALVVTTIFQRSAWRYRDRAYRRVFLDAGHLLGNLEVAGALCDYRPHLIGGFADERLNQLLYLNSEEESAIALLALADLFEIEQNLPPARSALPSPIHTDIAALPDGQLLGYLHQNTLISVDSGFGQQQQKDLDTPVLPVGSASAAAAIDTALADAENLDKSDAKAPEQPDNDESTDAQPSGKSPSADKYNFPFGIAASTKTLPIIWGDRLGDLEQTLLTRRSTRRYARAPLQKADLFALLDFTYHPEHYQPQEFDAHPDYFDLSLIETFVAISNVDGLESGCYYYAPQAEELRQIRFNQFHKDLHFLCLGQDLGRDAGAVIFHTADLEQAIAKYGDRVYRYLHMDAGHLGQRLNLAATRRGIGVSGIAGFFDDQVNELLSIPAEEAVLYITTVGKKPSR
ncbi:SagB/ThcOx family dehydrogenase [cf. Phormidesmis sp. LEGE 11477]|uniref:SagB/ThcOx family dehydrogenase n=1 Tax=cf. Phormidesmis sp. LEGE 11477 TaxID=1828680 RepID=UPI00187F42DF|nr:SagB/ThcOx family dehydrogenase [cf. Phormidesmis sp. LEGE 11477]MBE9062026.1 SagB/ThcOx family dehydrogenase [cf. Phormidesmis sp. LEGE 11477]